MIENVVEAMLNRDYVALSKLFAKQCRYFDYCPIGMSKENYHIYGSAGVEMFFHNKFFFHLYNISDVKIINQDTADYLVAYEGNYLHAQASIEKYSDDGLIEEFVVRPS